MLNLFQVPQFITRRDTHTPLWEKKNSKTNALLDKKRTKTKKIHTSFLSVMFIY